MTLLKLHESAHIIKQCDWLKVYIYTVNIELIQ